MLSHRYIVSGECRKRPGQAGNALDTGYSGCEGSGNLQFPSYPEVHALEDNAPLKV